MSTRRKIAAFLFFAGVGILIYVLGATNCCSIDTLRVHYREMESFAETHYVLTPFLMVGSYALFCAISLPVNMVYPVAFGLLFSQPWATFYSLIGATAGSLIAFLVARRFLANTLCKRYEKQIKKVQVGFAKNEVSYLILLRFTPFLPLLLLNVIPALAEVRLMTFLISVVIGVAPGAYLFSQAGREFDAVFDQSGPITLWNLMTPGFILTVAGATCLIIIPLIIKRWRGIRGKYGQK